MPYKEGIKRPYFARDDATQYNKFRSEPNLNHEIERVLDLINGRQIEQNLTTFASIGGERYNPHQNKEIRYQTNRIALIAIDLRAREELVEPWMHEAGMTVYRHPLASIGYSPEVNLI